MNETAGRSHQTTKSFNKGAATCFGAQNGLIDDRQQHANKGKLVVPDTDMEKTDSNQQSQGKTERAIEVILQADQPAVQFALWCAEHLVFVHCTVN